MVVIVFYTFIKERFLTLGAKGKVIEPVLWYAVFGSAVEALYYKFIQKEPAPAADRPVFQSMPGYTVFLPASETTDNKAILRHFIQVHLLMGEFYTTRHSHIFSITVWKSL